MSKIGPQVLPPPRPDFARGRATNRATGPKIKQAPPWPHDYSDVDVLGRAAIIIGAVALCCIIIGFSVAIVGRETERGSRPGALEAYLHERFPEVPR